MRRLLSLDTPATSRLSQVASALGGLAREGTFSTAERDRALAAFASDLDAILVVELTEEVTAKATDLLRRHRLRAGDAIQLASGVFLREKIGEAVGFVAFDRRLTEVARLEGLDVEPRRR